MTLAETWLRALASFSRATPAAWWVVILIVAPLLGSFITEPAAMTIAALLLERGDVQDAMLRLAEKYAHKPAAELPLLFQRILQNAIRDHYRRQKVRSLWTTLLSSLHGRDGDEERDPLDTLEVEQGRMLRPAEELERTQVLALIEQGLGNLPARQRQAFLLRYWEELDVAETAQAKGSSEGSVKTHCSRAVHSLARALKAKGVQP